MSFKNYDTGKPILNLIFGIALIVGLIVSFYLINNTWKDTRDLPGGNVDEFQKFCNFTGENITKIIILMDTVDTFDNSEITIKNKQIIKEFKDSILLLKKGDKAAGRSTQQYNGTYFITFYLSSENFYSIMVRGDPNNENPNKSFIIFFKNSFFDMASLEWENGQFPNYFKVTNGYSGNTYIDYKIHGLLNKVKDLTKAGHNRKEQIYIMFH